MKGTVPILIAVMLIVVAGDYIKPIDVPLVTDNNPLPWIEEKLTSYFSSQETTGNVIDMSGYNMDFEYGTIGWHLHNLYSVPPDYWGSTFEDAKSGYQSLRLAHTCTSTGDALRVEQTKQCLFRTDKLPIFDGNMYVKFYIKSLRKYENTWWDDPLYEFSTLTTHSFNVEAIDEWGERIYTKDIVSDIYNYQNSQLVKVVEYDMVNEGNASDYFKKLNGYDYNATYNGDLTAIQAMIDLQNSLTSGKVYYYVADTNTLPVSSYAVYLGDGWYTIIMPIPKETRYLGFNSQVYCSGQNETWSYGPYMTVYYPDAPADADTLTYLDGITFIRSIQSSDVSTTTNNTTDNNGDTTNSNTGTNISGNTTLNDGTIFQKIFRILILIVIFGIIFILAFPKRSQGVKKKLGINKIEKSTRKLPKPKMSSEKKPIYVTGHYRVPKGEGKGKGGIF